MKHKVRIIDISDKYLVGKNIKMSLTNDKTYPLWRDFKSQVLSIKNRSNSNFYSVQIYDSNLNFDEFKADTIFESWATVEVVDLSEQPISMEKLTIPKGK